MVQRNYQAPQFQVQDRRTVEARGVVQADTRPNYDRAVGDEQWRDRLVSQLGQAGAQLFDKAADIERGNLYLEGQASVGLIESEDELQGNPLTRDWKVAGYRDTVGKLALADMQASFQQDLVTLREKGGDDFHAYLTERRQKMLPVLSGMSREARMASAGQMLLQDRDATKRWTSEHAKFIIEQKSQAVHTQWGVAMRGLADAQVQALRPEDFAETLRNTAGTIVSSVWMDKSLPDPVKRQLTFEMAQAALANDSVALYDYLNGTPSPDKVLDGSEEQASTLISRLEGDQQLKLANAYREARARTNDARSLLRFEELANIDSQIDNDVYTGSYDDLAGKLRAMVLNKTISASRMETTLNKFRDKQYKNEQNSVFADALIRGDMQALHSAGKDASDGVKALEKMMGRRGLSPAQQLQTWVTVGRNGVQEGYKKVGEYLGVSLRQMVDSKDGKVLPQHAELFRSINSSIRQAEAEGLSNTRANVLSGLGDADRMFAERIFRRVDQGASLDEAVQEAKKVQADEASMTPSTRAATSQATAKDVDALVKSIDGRGLLATGWDKVKAMFGSTKAAADLALRPEDRIGDRDNWFQSSPTVDFYVNQSRTAVSEEAQNVALLNPMSTADKVVTVAKANVAARTISTNQGPLIMPRNVNLETTFGVAPGNQAAIGHAIDGMLQSTVADSRWQLAFSQGRLFAQEFDKDGNRVGTGHFISPDQIKARIAEDTAKESKAANERYGSGKVVQADGATLRYSGTNSAGVSNDWMLAFRDNLVKNEGVRSATYTDTVGRKTVGVGVAEGNPNFPTADATGKITSEQLTGSFNGASDDAAKAGSKIASRIGLESKAGFLLMSELAYHSGTAFAFQKNATGDEYRSFIKAVRSGDLNEASKAFQSTAAYRVSGEDRRKHYLNLLAQAMYNPHRASGFVTN